MAWHLACGWYPVLIICLDLWISTNTLANEIPLREDPEVEKILLQELISDVDGSDVISGDKRFSPNSFGFSRGRRLNPASFSFNRGKKADHVIYDDIMAAERYEKRAPPSGFNGVRGKRRPPAGYVVVRGKRVPPSGFTGLRGKKAAPSGDVQGYDWREKKSPPEGFLGLRGKKAAAPDVVNADTGSDERRLRHYIASMLHAERAPSGESDNKPDFRFALN